MYYAFIAFSAILLAVQFVLLKFYQERMGNSTHATLAYNALCGLFTIIIFVVVNLILNGKWCNITPFTLIMTASISLLIGLYTVLGFRIISMGKLAIYSLFLMLGGMILPFVYGLIFLGEASTETTSDCVRLVLRFVGIALLITSLVLSNTSKSESETEAKNKDVKKSSKVLFIVLSISVFVINGFVSILSKEHQINTIYPMSDEIDFNVLCGFSKFAIFAVAMACCSIKKRPDFKKVFKTKGMLPHILLNTFFTAAVVGLSFYLQLVSASHVAASAMYPMVTGGTVVFTTIGSAQVFRERLSRRETAGIVLCIIATLLFL